MQMIRRNVPYASGCWITETGFNAYQREVRPDNQDHMPAEGLSDQPSLRLHIADTCVLSHRNTHTHKAHIGSISKSRWNTLSRKEMEKGHLYRI